jgi:YidC/Oxa1 family membrane protein insertase
MDQKRLFLAIAISVAILLGFQLLIAPHLPHPPPPPPAQVANSANPTQSSSLTPAQGGAVAAATAAAPKNVPRVKIAAPRLSGSMSLLGARLDDLVLTDYRDPGTEFAERPPAGAAVGQRALLRAVWLERHAG